MPVWRYQQRSLLCIHVLYVCGEYVCVCEGGEKNKNPCCFPLDICKYNPLKSVCLAVKCNDGLCCTFAVVAGTGTCSRPGRQMQRGRSVQSSTRNIHDYAPANLQNSSAWTIQGPSATNHARTLRSHTVFAGCFVVVFRLQMMCVCMRVCVCVCAA